MNCLNTGLRKVVNCHQDKLCQGKRSRTIAQKGAIEVIMLNRKHEA